MIKNIRDIYRGVNDFKKGYQTTTNLAKNEKDDLVVESYSILARWRKYFSQLLNVHEVNCVKHTDIHTAEPLMPEPGDSELELAVEKPESHKSPGIDQIPKKLIKAGSRTLFHQIKKLIISICNKEGLLEEWKESIIFPIYKKAKKQTVIIIGSYTFCQLRTKFYPTFCCQD